MLSRKLLTILILAGASLVPALSLAAESTAAESTNPPVCALRTHRVTSVSPYRVEEHVGRTAFSVVRGAALTVEAEPGLTAEWLRQQLGRHLTEMRGATMKDCALNVNDVRVEVESSGAGFLVHLIAPNTEKGEEVLRRARMSFG